MNLTLPPQGETTPPANPNGAPVSYTAEEISYWQWLRASWNLKKSAELFEVQTGKPHDPHFLI